MNKNKSQSGNTRILIIIVIGILLLGGLGFAVWQIFIKPKNVNTQTNSNELEVPAETTGTNTSAIENGYTLSIDDWGIKGLYKGNNRIKYATDTKFSQSISFTSDDLTGDCRSYKVGSIQRLTGNQIMEDVDPGGYDSSGDKRTIDEAYSGSVAKFIGKYYYIYVSPQQACYQESTKSYDATAIQIADDFYKFYETLEAI